MWKRYLRTNVLFSVIVAKALVSQGTSQVSTYPSREVA
jgi:hypothetical protein